MRIINCVELEPSEAKAISFVLGLIDEIADASGESMDNVFDYINRNSYIDKNDNYVIDSKINLDDI